MRPKGFKNPNQNYSASLAGAYEAGADAYEEGLKKEGTYVEDSAEPIETCGSLRGWWVFIPDED